MLRRGSGGSNQRLSRRKSTSSVISKSLSIDPETARIHAQAAATYAFEQARRRGKAEQARGEMLPRTNSVQGHGALGKETGYYLTQDCPVLPQIKRQQSVRFAGPLAVQRQRSVGTRALQSIQPKPSSATLRSRAVTTNMPVPAEYRPPSRSSSIGKPSFRHGPDCESRNYMAALAAYDEYYTKEDDVASTPSSYRRIRKSKSFLSPGKVSGIMFNNGTPSVESSSRSFTGRRSLANLRAPKSMRFLRGGRNASREGSHTQDHDAAVQAARDEFLHQVEQQRLREQPSFIFRSRARPEEKPFRKSLRDNILNAPGYVPNASGHLSLEDGLRVRARKVSLTLKNTIKGLFKRGVNEEPAVIPTQQIESWRSHGPPGNPERTTLHHIEQSCDISRPDDATMYHVASRLPSIHAAKSNQQLRSRKGSVQSLRSVGSDKSRVTSWANTDPADTANSRHTFTEAEKERQRLSIIHENGTHMPSTTFGKHELSDQFTAYSPHRFVRGGSAVALSVQPTGKGAVNSARIYSALMKRLEENSPRAKLAQLRASTESLLPRPPIPPRSSSVGSHHSSRGTPATIRQVYEDAREVVEPEAEIWRYSPVDKHVPIRPRSQSTVCATQRRSCSLSKTPSTKSTHESLTSRLPPKMKELRYLTPQELALEAEPVLPRPRHIRETRSGFFGGADYLAIARGRSPYRRALDESYCYDPAVITGEIPVRHSPGVPVHHIPRTAAFDGSPLAYSDSVYSRTTSGQPNPMAGSFVSLAIQDDDVNLATHGSMVVTERATYKPSNPQHRATASNGSAEFKSWMSKQVSHLENSRGVNSVNVIGYAVPTMGKTGHVREHAEITGEQTSLLPRKSRSARQPLGLILQNDHPRPTLKNKSSIASISTIPPAPPLPPLSPLRHTRKLSKSSLPSKPSVATLRTMSANEASRKALYHSKHQASIGTLHGADEPAKLVKRHMRRPSNVTLPSPGITAAVDRQFGSASSKATFATPPAIRGAENISPGRDM